MIRRGLGAVCLRVQGTDSEMAYEARRWRDSAVWTLASRLQRGQSALWEIDKKRCNHSKGEAWQGRRLS